MNDNSSIARDAKSAFSRFLSRKKPLVALLLFSLALFLRAVYFLETRDTVVLHTEEITTTDMSFFHGWARTISLGNWLTDCNLHAFHPVYLEIAPRAKWLEWYGNKTFHQEPLYAYFIALIYRVFGPKPFAVIWVQFLLGSMLAVVLFYAGAKYFDINAGFFAALISALYGPFIFHEGMLLRATLGAFLGGLVLLGSAWAFEKPKAKRFFLIGLAIGVSFLLRANALLFLAAISAGLLFKGLKERRFLIALFPLLFGFVLMLLPLPARNLLVGAPTFSFSSVGTTVLINTNAPGRAKTAGFPLSDYYGEVMEKSNGRMLPAAKEILALHKSIYGNYRALLRKGWDEFRFFWRWADIPDNFSYYYARSVSLVLKLLIPSGIIFLLAIAGILVSLPLLRPAGEGRFLWILYCYIAAQVAVAVVFYANGRLRLPAVPALVIFAGYSIRHLGGIFRKRSLRGCRIVPAIFLGFICVYGFHPSKDFSKEEINRDSDQIYGIMYYLQRHSPEKALALLESPRSFSITHLDRGGFYLSLGLPSRAITESKKAIPENPENASLFRNLGYAYFQIGWKAEAVEAWEKSLRLNPKQPDLLKEIKLRKRIKRRE